MPRRKQGHSKESATGGCLQKRLDTDTDIIHNATLKNTANNDLVFKMQKTVSSSIFNSACEEIERGYVETSKSLNDINMALQYEVNNNFIKSVSEMEESMNKEIVLKNCSNDISRDDSKETSVEEPSTPKDIVSFASSTSMSGKKQKSKPNIRSKPSNSLDFSHFLRIESSSQNQNNACDSSLVKINTCPTPVKSAPVVSHPSVIKSEDSKSDAKKVNQVSSIVHENAIGELFTSMSGVTPSVSDKTGQKLESQQLNYRVSTSIVETRNSSKDSLQQVIDEEQNCHLPSSVYGTSASNIEKVLTGLKLPDTSKENSKVLNSGKVSFLQEILENKTRDSVLTRRSSSFSEGTPGESTIPLSEHNIDYSNDKYCFNTSSTCQRDTRSNSLTRNSSKLKLHIPECSNTDDSNSSVLSTESQKPIKFPKITSPQILEQHISKIISENAAIVETLDPMWSRRYLKQSSLNSSSEFESKKQNLVKLNSSSEDKTMNIIIQNGAPSNAPKLQSALLGGSPADSFNASQKLSSKKISLPKEKSFSHFSVSSSAGVSSSSMCSKTVCSVPEEELKGSAIKSLLSLKRGRYPKQTNPLDLDETTYNPSSQNPGGSIIKDLLLKSKSKEEPKLLVDANDPNPMSSTYSIDVDYHPEIHLKCSYCSAEFSNKCSLDVHLSFCKNSGKQFFLRDLADTKSTHAQSYKLPTEYQLNFDTKVQGAETRYESILDKVDENDGPILKKQLLLPLPKSPPLKRRKVSDPVLLSSFLNEKSSESMNGKNDMHKIIPSNSSSDLTLSPHRGRSQSVHLFGGEVQILDGSQTKKIKIKTSIPGAFSSFGKFSDSFGTKNFQSLPEAELDKRIKNFPGVIVTIAQPVHNSGGTVHLPTRPSTVSPVLSIPNSFSDKLQTSFHPDISRISSNTSIIKSPCKKKEAVSILSNQPFAFLPGPDGFPAPLLSETSMSPTMSYGMDKAGCPEMSLSVIKEPIFLEKKAFQSSFFSSAEKSSSTIFLNNKMAELENSPVVPTVIFTPSSPTHQSENEISPPDSISQNSKKFLAPARPTSLSLKEKPFTMVGSTLISPETPRPKKSCIQLYLNGHAYTYLGLKCSTRSTYCCIYRPQPMFVLQETNPKLSMYSNWQVVPAKEELSGLTPGQMISFYCSKQKTNLKSIVAIAKLGEPLIFTHSSYWTYRSKDADNKRLSQTDANQADANQAEAYQAEDFPEACKESPSELSHHKDSITSSVGSKSELQVLSADESSIRPDTDNTSDGEIINSDDDDDDDDCQDDGTESLTDSSQPVPPKRVKIFEGGFKSNEDYTYVRGRGRGKYVCEECGIRCKKPSMLKKHIRTHTDLRPYKCKHCSFAFKTKGNLTKHMKSKAHHKKCTELGIVPVPTTTDDSQIDEEALAKQEQIEKKKHPFSDGEDADDDDDDESDESDDECESDASSMITSNQKSRMLTNGHSKKSESQDKLCADNHDENTRGNDSVSQQSVEQEAARSLLHLSAFGESSQWSNSTGDITDVASSGETETGSLLSRYDQPLSSPLPYAPLTMSSTILSSMRSKLVSDQWLSTDCLGHRPRSYSADVPMGGGKEKFSKYSLVKGKTTEASMKTTMEETSEFGNKEQYVRRYSISVAREARKPRILNPPDWDGTGFPSSSVLKWPNAETLDQPMDLSISRDLGKCKSIYSHGASGSLLNVMPQGETAVDAGTSVPLDACLSESFQLKTLPVLSPQALVDYETTGEGNSETSLLSSVEDKASFVGNNSRPLYFVPDVSNSDQILSKKETEGSEDPPSPDLSEYTVCSPVSPPVLDDNSYYYSQDNTSQNTTVPEDNPTSRFHAEFIVPSSSSSNMEEGKCVCRICNKIFAKSSQLRLHVNIHYFERPFRCDNCAVSFRTKGHLQKHKRSVSHYNKVNMNLTFGTPTVDNPRPFKCADCKIAFRIHGHLAKHLRSKMHIMKLECLGKLPFGMYAEMERSGVSLNEIDTTDCNNSLESLQVMAQKLYQRDPRRMRWQGPEHIGIESDCAMSASPISSTLTSSMLPVSTPIATNFDPSSSAIGIPVSTINAKYVSESEEVKREPSESENLCLSTVSYVEEKNDSTSLSRYIASQSNISANSDLNQRVEVTENESSVSLHRSGTCHICGRLFKSAKFLQVHLYCDHSTGSPSMSEVVSTNSSVQSNANSKELVCDLCGKLFPNQKTLEQHILSHAQPRPFVCEVCDAGFTSSSSLITHQTTHKIKSSASTAKTRLVQ